MKKAPKYVEIDLASLRTIRHSCDFCADRSKVPSCCASFEICITKAEMERIVGIMPEVARRCPSIRASEDLDNVFEEIDGGGFAIETRDNGSCVFAYRKDRKVYCGIHSTLIKMGLPWRQIKPPSCILWPLSISEDRVPTISVDESAAEFHCNVPREDSELGLDDSILEILRLTLGEEAMATVERDANRGLLRTRVLVGGVV